MNSTISAHHSIRNRLSLIVSTTRSSSSTMIRANNNTTACCKKRWISSSLSSSSSSSTNRINNYGLMCCHLKNYNNRINNNNTNKRLLSTIPKQKEFYNPEESFFSRHMATIAFSSIIGAIVTFFYRSSVNKDKRQEYLDICNKEVMIEPFEIDLLRVVNDSLINPENFMEIVNAVHQAFPEKVAKYSEFVKVVLPLIGNKPIQRGYLLDRIIISKQDSEVEKELDVRFLLTVFSLTLNSTLDEREEVLYRMHQIISEKGDGNENGISIEELVKLVNDLIESDQLLPSKRVWEDPSESYPFQLYKIATPLDMTKKALTEMKCNEDDVITPELFMSFLESKTICAWNECFKN